MRPTNPLQKFGHTSSHRFLASASASRLAKLFHRSAAGEASALASGTAMALAPRTMLGTAKVLANIMLKVGKSVKCEVVVVVLVKCLS